MKSHTSTHCGPIFLDVWISFLDLIGDLRISAFLSTENSFSILSRGEKNNFLLSDRFGTLISALLASFFHGLATDLSDLTINNLLIPDLVCVVTAHMVYF